MDEWFRISVDEDDLEVIHHEPPTPQCPIDGMLMDISVDKRTVEELVAEGKARYCPICFR